MAKFQMISNEDHTYRIIVDHIDLTKQIQNVVIFYDKTTQPEVTLKLVPMDVDIAKELDAKVTVIKE